MQRKLSLYKSSSRTFNLPIGVLLKRCWAVHCQIYRNIQNSGSQSSHNHTPEPYPHNSRQEIKNNNISKSYIVANQQSQHCVPVREDFRSVGVMVADSVVVELGKGIMRTSEEGDEGPGETIYER